MATATYQVRSRDVYKLSGVAKVRLRAASIWFWDEEDRILMVVPAEPVTLVRRVDLDAGTADDDVLEIVLNDGGLLPDRPLMWRIPGVTSSKVIELPSHHDLNFLEFRGDDKKLPQALVREAAFIIRREGARLE
jgi:hypothetical protein